jgi:tungstate transport system ATP-binding protein
MTQAPIFRLKEVTRRYGDSFRLNLESLDISEGSRVGLLGPTGAGKSTLLRLLSGLERPDTGEITFDGVRWGNSKTSLDVIRQIAMVHQRPLLLSGTVLYNVTYGLAVRNKQKPKLVDETIDQLGLRKLVNQSARTLSGGQTQLVALARALVIEPKVLLLDEPTANLDPAHVAVIEQTLSESQKRLNTTIIWATHNLFQARRVADHAGLLLNGELIEVAPTERFFNAPSDSRAIDFVEGRMIF